MTDEEYAARMAEIRKLLPREALAALAGAHEEYGWTCAAHNEGQTCCLDLLTG